MRGPIGETLGVDGRQRLLGAVGESVAGEAEVGRAERHVVVDGGHEELIVGVLEDQPDASADLAQVVGDDFELSDAHRT